MSKTVRDRLTFSLNPSHIRMLEQLQQKHEFVSISEALRTVLDDYSKTTDREISIVRSFENMQSTLTLITRTLVAMQNSFISLLKQYEESNRRFAESANQQNPELLAIRRQLKELQSAIHDLQFATPRAPLTTNVPAVERQPRPPAEIGTLDENMDLIDALMGGTKKK